MFRSGTTLLARMFDAHEDVVCASDPFRPFFNCLRDEIADDVDVDVDSFDPLDSYFADADQYRLFDRIQRADLERSFPNARRTPLEDRITTRGKPFSPMVIERIEEVAGETFGEVYDRLLSHVQPAYGSGGERLVGTKETWSTEFVPALARHFPEMRFVLVVRDPRAVTASKNVNKESKYPWLFLIRQWRKLASLAWLYENHASFADRVLLVGFEELIAEPDAVVGRLCDFLDVDVDERIMDPSNYTDGHGEPWRQNTSYDDPKSSFNQASIDKWKDVHDPHVVEFVERLCYPEMELFGYDLEQAGSMKVPEKFLCNPPAVPIAELADWIRPYYEDRTPVAHRNDVACEAVRRSFLTAPRSEIERVPDEVALSYFLDETYFEAIRSLNIYSHERAD